MSSNRATADGAIVASPSSKALASVAVRRHHSCATDATTTA